MATLRCFEIHFDHQPFYTGGAVTGHVKIVLDGPLQARALILGLTGWEHCSVTDGGNSAGPVDGTGLQTNGVVLWRQEESNVEGVLPVGEHTFKLSVPLPITCPMSFDGRYGHIRYFAEATVDRSSWVDDTVQREFGILGFVDLNSEHGLAKRSIASSDSASLLCFCGENVELEILLPRSGFVPGERLPLKITITNSSSYTVVKIVVKLVQQTIYTALVRRGKTKSRKCTSVVLTKRLLMRQGGTAMHELRDVRVPTTVTPSKFGRFTRVEYEITVERASCETNADRMRICKTHIIRLEVPARVSTGLILISVPIPEVAEVPGLDDPDPGQPDRRRLRSSMNVLAR